jgi:hypothetical protein
MSDVRMIQINSEILNLKKRLLVFHISYDEFAQIISKAFKKGPNDFCWSPSHKFLIAGVSQINMYG